MAKIIQQIKIIQHAEITNYSQGLNTVKAFLILIVIFGHSINIYSNLQIIYFFHMPLFLSISGYLVKKSAFDKGIFSFLKKLTNRAIIPWFIAFCVFIPVLLFNKSITSFSFKNILYPYYHLWYIPAYLIAVIFCYFTLALKIPSLFVLITTVLITSYWFILYRNNLQQPEQLPLYFLGDKRIYGYLLFFYLGFAIRNKIINFRPNVFVLISLIGITIIAILAFIFKHLPEFNLLIPYLICNICLVFFILIYTSSQNWINNKFLKFLNDQSLGIYLYHPLFIFIAYQWLQNPERDKSSSIEALIIFVITTVFSTVLVWIFTKFEITNKYVLGNVKKMSV